MRVPPHLVVGDGEERLGSPPDTASTPRPACTTCLRLRLDLMVGGQDLVSPGEQGTPLGLTLRLVLAPRQEYLEVSR
jgi:hypothetical protein